MDSPTRHECLAMWLSRARLKSGVSFAVMVMSYQHEPDPLHVVLIIQHEPDSVHAAMTCQHEPDPISVALVP